MTDVLLFARARELAGTRRISLDGATASEVLAAAVERFGEEFAALARTCTIVVDGETVAREQLAVTPSGDEMAILPPVSGGAVEDHHGEDASTGPLRAVVVTVSDRASSGVYEDRTGPAVGDLLDADGQFHVVGVEVIADDAAAIGDAITRWCDSGRCDLLVTNGGTGLSPRDVTPEATRSVLDVEAPGIAELMRASGLASTPMAALSRQVAGRRGRSIVVNLPGSVAGATESLAAALPVLAHAVAQARRTDR